MVTLIAVLGSFLLLSTTLFLFLRTERFGALSAGDRLRRIQRSPHFQNGQFQNLSPTPDLTEGANFFSVTVDFLFRNSKRSSPERIVGVKTDLHRLPASDLFVWFGHSSYLMQLDGQRILVDPVFGGNASPLKFTTRSFTGSDLYTPDDLPPIDILIITHDHWDHLDFRTVKKIRNKVSLVVTGLGTGAHLERWGYQPQQIVEMDWNESVSLGNFTFDSVPARHFSGRGFRRNQALWMSLVLSSKSRRIFVGGDSGYDAHFSRIGAEFGPFDLAILECGQYNKAWKFIHMMPEEVIDAGFDLKAKAVLPVHWAKFTLALHDWDEPIQRVVKEGSRRGMPVLHPRIGEVTLLENSPAFAKWWESDMTKDQSSMNVNQSKA